MSIDEISAISLDVVSAGKAIGLQEPVSSGIYRNVVENLESISTQIADNSDALASMALGDIDNLHQVIIGMEKARLNFELMMSVRNRALEAYQELMRMQL